MPSVAEIAALLGGEVHGDGSLSITGLGTLDGAKQGEISFLTNPKYARKVGETSASALITGTLLPEPIVQIVVKNPYLAFAKLLTLFAVKPEPVRGIMPGATVDPSAEIGEGVTIYPGCYVGERSVIGKRTVLHPNTVVYRDVQIGENCLIHAGSLIREGSILGDRVILQPGAVVGSDGFGFAPDGRAYYKIPQIGRVVLEDDVEIGSCTCIDRAALEVTRIKRGTKVDNLVQIAHNVVVGEDTVIAGQAGIAGSAVIGDHCTLGGRVAVAGHISVGDEVTFGGGSNVAGNVDSNQILSGYPLLPHKEWLRVLMSMAKLPEMRKEILRLQKELELLKSQSMSEEE